MLSGASSDNTFGAVLSLNCETDFVAKNDSFIDLTTSLLDLAIENKAANKEALLGLAFKGMTVAEKLVEQTGVIGEKLEIGSYEVIEAPYVATYIHAGNKLATLVGLSAEAEEAGKNVAMQAAAMNPISLDRDGVSQETVAREIEVGKDLARQEGKPEAMLDKIAEGRLNKFFKENTLVEQDYIRDGKLTVAKYLQSVNADLKAVAYKRVGLGV